MKETRADTIVVGAGVIGLSVAYELARRGREVLVVERDRPGAGASRVAAGMLAPVCEAPDHPQDLTELCLESARRYPRFVACLEADAGRSTGYREEGTLSVALSRDDAAELERLAAALAELDLPFERLDAARVRALEPRLSPRVRDGLYVRGDRQIDPRALLRALLRALRARGGRVARPHTVCEVLQEGRRAVGVRSVDPQGHERVWRAAHVVLAAGAWSGGGIAGAPALELRPVKGQLLRLAGEPLIGHVVRTPEVYLVPREDGGLLVGATVEEAGFDTTPTAGPTMDLLRRAWEALPACYDLAFAGVDVGLRPATDDHRPRIGPTAVEGLLLATGHYRNGILLAPLTAAAIADRICGDRPHPSTTAFAPAAERGAGVPR